MVKVEDPSGGDYLRWMPPMAGEQSGWFHALNRNKRSLALDLRRPEGPAALLRLARRFDVVVESFRPGVMARLGVGYDALSAVNPGLVLCSISGYGQDGPYRDRAGHDIDYVALAGVLAVNGPPERPVPLGVQVADVAGGSWPAVAGILAALLGRSATGKGAWVDVAMAEGALAMMALQQGAADAEGRALRRGGEQLNGGSACYAVYRAKDGGFVALGALEPKFFRAFCEAVGRPELGRRPVRRRRGRPARRGGGHLRDPHPRGVGRLRRAARRLRDAGARRGTSRAGTRSSSTGAASSRCRRPGRGGPCRAWPPRSGSAAWRRRCAPAPRIGADSDAVLAGSGFDAAEMAALRASGALG